MGDVGTGDPRARGVAARIRHAAHAAPVSHIFFLGDNVYEHGEADAIPEKFLDVYRRVFDLGVQGHAALGNHDVERCEESGRRPVPRDGSAYRAARDCPVAAHLATPEFGYRRGLRYYSIAVPAAPEPLVEVFVLDSNTLGEMETKLDGATDEPQLRWLAESLERSTARWKVVALHDTMYTPERCIWVWFRCRGADETLRAELEPILRQHGVDVVFQGHQHLYARLKPQHGIRYFVSGAGGKRPDPFRADDDTVPRADAGAFNHFVLVRATEDHFGYCVLDPAGAVRDRGNFAHRDLAAGRLAGDPCPVLQPIR